MPSPKTPVSASLGLALLGGVVAVVVDQVRPRGVIVFNLAAAALLGGTIGTYLGILINHRSRSPRSIAAGLVGGAASGLAVAFLFRAFRGNNEMYVGVASEVFAGLSDSLVAFLIFSLLFVVIGLLTGLSVPGASPRDVGIRSGLAASSCFVGLVLGEKVLAMTHSTSEVLRSFVAAIVLAAGFFPLVRTGRREGKTSSPVA